MFGNGVTRFLGGSPIGVLTRLLVPSFVVGLVFEALGYDPESLFYEAWRNVRHLIEFGFSDVRQVAGILLTGAMVVIPVWIVLRLLDAGRAR